MNECGGGVSDQFQGHLSSLFADENVECEEMAEAVLGSSIGRCV